MSDLWFFLTSVIWVLAIVAFVRASRAMRILRLQIEINKRVNFALATLGISVDALCSPKNLSEEDAIAARRAIEKMQVEMLGDTGVDA